MMTRKEIQMRILNLCRESFAEMPQLIAERWSDEIGSDGLNHTIDEIILWWISEWEEGFFACVDLPGINGYIVRLYELPDFIDKYTRNQSGWAIVNYKI